MHNSSSYWPVLRHYLFDCVNEKTEYKCPTTDNFLENALTAGHPRIEDFANILNFLRILHKRKCCTNVKAEIAAFFDKLLTEIHCFYWPQEEIKYLFLTINSIVCMKKKLGQKLVEDILDTIKINDSNAKKWYCADPRSSSTLVAAIVKLELTAKYQPLITSMLDGVRNNLAKWESDELQNCSIILINALANNDVLAKEQPDLILNLLDIFEQHPDKLLNIHPPDMAKLLNALAKLGLMRRSGNLIPLSFNAIQINIGAWETYASFSDISLTMNAILKTDLDKKKQKLISALLKIVAKKLQLSKYMSPENFSLTLNATVHAGFDDARQQLILDMLEIIGCNLEPWEHETPQNFTLLLNAIIHPKLAPRAERLISSLVKIIINDTQSISNASKWEHASPQDISILANVITQTEYTPEKKTLLLFLVNVTKGNIVVWQSANLKDFILFINALIRTGFYIQERELISNILDILAENLSRLLQTATPRDLALVLNAIYMARFVHEKQKLVSRFIAFIHSNLSQWDKADPQNYSLILNMLVESKLAQGDRTLILAILHKIPHNLEEWKHTDLQNISRLLNAVFQAGLFLEEKQLMSSMLEIVEEQQKHANKSTDQLNAQDLNLILNVITKNGLAEEKIDLVMLLIRHLTRITINNAMDLISILNNLVIILVYHKVNSPELKILIKTLSDLVCNSNDIECEQLAQIIYLLKVNGNSDLLPETLANKIFLQKQCLTFSLPGVITTASLGITSLEKEVNTIIIPKISELLSRKNLHGRIKFNYIDITIGREIDVVLEIDECSVKLAINIDGPVHFEHGEVDYCTKFRNWIINHLGYEVISNSFINNYGATEAAREIIDKIESFLNAQNFTASTFVAEESQSKAKPEETKQKKTGKSVSPKYSPQPIAQTDLYQYRDKNHGVQRIPASHKEKTHRTPQSSSPKTLFVIEEPNFCVPKKKTLKKSRPQQIQESLPLAYLNEVLAPSLRGYFYNGMISNIEDVYDKLIKCLDAAIANNHITDIPQFIRHNQPIIISSIMQAKTTSGWQTFLGLWISCSIDIETFANALSRGLEMKDFAPCSSGN